MNTYNYNIDYEIALLVKYRLTPTELFLIKVILLIQDGYPTDYLSKYLSIPEKDRGDIRQVFVSLQNKGIILKSYKIPEKGEVLDPLEIPVSKNFGKDMFRSSFELGKELFNAYPKFTYINGSLVQLRGVAKKFDTLEDFFMYYGKSIHWSIDLHKEILDLIEWDKSSNQPLLNQSIASFVINRGWEDLREARNGNLEGINSSQMKQL